jgi:putative hydrolase of the HAD superfamily
MNNNLILDIGNVICHWNPQKLVASVFDTEADQARAIADVIDQPDWVDLDRGTLTQDEAIKRACARSTLDPDGIAGIFDALPPSLTVIDSTVEAMYEVKAAGKGMYVLSNMHHLAWEYLERHYDFWHLFDGVVVSCQANFVKPNADIYEHLCERFNLQPQSCYFIDDMANNVQAAIDCGWQSEQLTDTAKGGDMIRQWLSR